MIAGAELRANSVKLCVRFPFAGVDWVILMHAREHLRRQTGGVLLNQSDTEFYRAYAEASVWSRGTPRLRRFLLSEATARFIGPLRLPGFRGPASTGSSKTDVATSVIAAATGNHASCRAAQED